MRQLAKRQTSNEIDDMISKETVIEKEVSEEMRTSFLTYSIMTIIDRALPDVRDGFKPVQRKILWSMDQQNIKPSGSFKKSARIVGDVIGKYHPHGDTACYGAMANMVNDFDIRYSLIHGQGNFGSADGDGPAAMRYTEAKLQKLAVDILKDVDCDAVDMVLNFSEDELEPAVLPGMFPALIVNGAQGIATGYTTAIPPHNLNEVADGIIALIKNSNITVEELVEKYIKGPDLPSFGYLIQDENIIKLYTTGQASLTFQGKLEIESNEENGNRQIVIVELPPEIKKSKLVEKFYNTYVTNKDKTIIDVRDESEGNGTRVVLELHKSVVPEMFIDDIYKSITKTQGYILRAIVEQAPVLLDLKQMMEYYLDHRRSVIERRTKFVLDKTDKRINILKGFEIAIANMKEIVLLIIDSESPADASKRLEAKFGINIEQSKSILAMQLSSLTKLEKDKILKELNELTAQSVDYNEILISSDRVNKIIIDELKYLKKTYGDDRKTKIIDAREKTKVPDKTVITDEPMFIALTNKNQIKTMAYTAFEGMIKNKSIKDKNNIFVQGLKSKMSNEYVIILEDGTYAKFGFGSLLETLDLGKKIIGIIPFSEEDTNDVIILISKNGLVKKIKINSLKSKLQKVTSLFEMDDKDCLIGVRMAQENESNVITLLTNNGLVHRFYLRGFSTTSQTAKGIGCIGMEDNDYIVDFDISDISKDGTNSIIIFNSHSSKKNSWKTMKLNEFTIKNRMAKGTKAIPIIKNDKISSSNMMLVDNDFFMIGQNGELLIKKLTELKILQKADKPQTIDFTIVTSKFLL